MTDPAEPAEERERQKTDAREYRNTGMDAPRRIISDAASALAHGQEEFEQLLAERDQAIAERDELGLRMIREQNRADTAEYQRDKLAEAGERLLVAAEPFAHDRHKDAPTAELGAAVDQMDAALERDDE